MKLSISTSGGIGGFGLSPRPVTIDVDSLGKELGERVRKAFALPKLQALAKKTGNPHAADLVGYEVTITSDSGVIERVELSGGSLPAELLDLIDELIASN